MLDTSLKTCSVLRFFPRTVVCCPMLSQNPYGMNNNKIKCISIEYIITLKIRVKTSNRCINPHTRSLHLYRKFSFLYIFFPNLADNSRFFDTQYLGISHQLSQLQPHPIADIGGKQINM